MSNENSVERRLEREYDRKLNKIHQEDNLFTSRINLFLVAESMLLISYVTSLNFSKDNDLIGLLLIILAIALTLVFWNILNKNVDYIKQLRTNLEDAYPSYKEERDKKPITYANDLLGFVLPFVFLIVWIILIFNMLLI